MRQMIRGTQRRLFSALSAQAQRAQVVAPFKTVFEQNKVTAVDRNIPVSRRTKAWERDEVDKETYFRKKFAHVHARSKAKREDSEGSGVREKEFRGNERDRGRGEKRASGRSRLENTRSENRSDRRGRYDDAKAEGNTYGRRREFFSEDPVAKLRPSPLHDYVFGVGPVMAALQANRRGAFTELLFHNPKERHDEIVQLARELDVPLKKSTKMALNQLTNNNVHNGYVLKTKPLLPTEILRLGAANAAEGTYEIVRNVFGQQEVDQHRVARSVSEGRKRNPFGIYLDEISDPHNVGAIIRTAYYLGVDFIVMSEKNCSKLTPVVSKSSSGAMEFLPIYSTTKAVQLFEESQLQGWKFISSVVGPQGKKNAAKSVDVDDLESMLQENPCILVFGSEGTGVRTNLMTRSDGLVTLTSSRPDISDSIDSLNVSVAAGLLLQKFLA